MSKPAARKKANLLEPINSRAVALEVIKQSAIAFFVVGIIQGVVGIFLWPTMLFDAVLYVVLGLALLYLRSRIVALLLLLLSGAALVMTVMNSAGITVGGSNVFVALVVCGAALRAVEATFKLHGRFAHELDEGQLDQLAPTTESAQAKSGLTSLEWALAGLALLLVMVLLVVVLLVMG
jgi:hypothetical protein